MAPSDHTLDEIQRSIERLQKALDDLRRPRGVQVCADELRTGDRIVSDRDPDIVNTVVSKPQWVVRYKDVWLVIQTANGDLIDKYPVADELFTVLEPRPAPIWADDPFGTPNTLAVSPYGVDACDGGALPQEARR